MCGRMRLSQGVLAHLEMCTRESEFRRFAREQMAQQQGEIPLDSLWGMFEENSRYADVINLSSRPVGNEEALVSALISLHPAFSRYLIDDYKRQGYIQKEDVESAYRNRNFYPALTMAIVRNWGGCRRRFF